MANLLLVCVGILRVSPPVMVRMTGMPMITGREGIGDVQEVWYACGGRSQAQAMFRKYGYSQDVMYAGVSRSGHRRFTGSMVCMQRQEPRASDVQDERLFTGCDVDRH